MVKIIEPEMCTNCFPAVSSWTTKASMPTSRSVTASAVLDGKVWVVGGIDFSWSDKVEIFDPSTNSWTSGPSLNSPVSLSRLGFLGYLACSRRV